MTNGSLNKTIKLDTDFFSVNSKLRVYTLSEDESVSHLVRFLYKISTKV